MKSLHLVSIKSIFLIQEKQANLTGQITAEVLAVSDDSDLDVSDVA